MDTHGHATTLGHRAHHGLPLAATLGALGIVYGDIGTSPLYAFKEAAKAASGYAALEPGAVLGVLSLMLLGPDPRRLAEIRHPDPARRQPRRGWHHGHAR